MLIDWMHSSTSWTGDIKQTFCSDISSFIMPAFAKTFCVKFQLVRLCAWSKDKSVLSEPWYDRSLFATISPYDNYPFSERFSDLSGNLWKDISMQTFLVHHTTASRHILSITYTYINCLIKQVLIKEAKGLMWTYYDKYRITQKYKQEGVNG